MIELNKCFLVGNLTRDPEVRYLPSGSAATQFDIAVNRKYKDKSGEKKEETLFIRINTFARVAEVCGEFLKKGQKVLVEGRLREDTWEAKDGSGKRSKMCVVAQSVQFFPGRTGATDAPLPSSDSQSRNSGPDAGEYGSNAPADTNSNLGSTEDDLPF